MQNDVTKFLGFRVKARHSVAVEERIGSTNMGAYRGCLHDDEGPLITPEMMHFSPFICIVEKLGATHLVEDRGVPVNIRVDTGGQELGLGSIEKGLCDKYVCKYE